MSKKCGQLLDANVVAINRVLSPRRDLANDGGGVARLRWMIGWGFENFEMPVVKIHVSAVGRLRRSAIGCDQITREVDDLFFECLQLLPLFLGQIRSMFGFGLRIELGEAF